MFLENLEIRYFKNIYKSPENINKVGVNVKPLTKQHQHKSDYKFSGSEKG